MPQKAKSVPSHTAVPHLPTPAGPHAPASGHMPCGKTVRIRPIRPENPVPERENARRKPRQQTACKAEQEDREIRPFLLQMRRHHTKKGAGTHLGAGPSIQGQRLFLDERDRPLDEIRQILALQHAVCQQCQVDDLLDEFVFRTDLAQPLVALVAQRHDLL